MLLPVDPDGSARRLRAGLLQRTGRNIAVLVTDTAGRAWRTGQTDIAIGAAGLRVTEPLAGRTDPHGNPLAVTKPAVAHELAGTAELVQGQTWTTALRRHPRPRRPRPPRGEDGTARHRPTGPGPPRRTAMNHDDTDPIDDVQPSATERQLRRLVGPEPGAYAPNKRLDVIHEPDVDLLWGDRE